MQPKRTQSSYITTSSRYSLLNKPVTLVLQKLVAPTGTLISEKVPQNPFSGTVGWESKRFAYGAIVTFRTEDAAKAGLDNCHFEVSRMNIFDPTMKHPTVVTLDTAQEERPRQKKNTIREDMHVAISTHLGIRYITSQERVSVYEYRQGESFLVCLSGCRENIIDGYYIIYMKRSTTTY